MSKNDPGEREVYSDSTQRGEHAFKDRTSEQMAKSQTRGLRSRTFWVQYVTSVTTGGDREPQISLNESQDSQVLCDGQSFKLYCTPFPLEN